MNDSATRLEEAIVSGLWATRIEGPQGLVGGQILCPMERVVRRFGRTSRAACDLPCEGADLGSRGVWPERCREGARPTARAADLGADLEKAPESGNQWAPSARRPNNLWPVRMGWTSYTDTPNFEHDRKTDG